MPAFGQVDHSLPVQAQSLKMQGGDSDEDVPLFLSDDNVPLFPMKRERE
jgi:hypothetical protein